MKTEVTDIPSLLHESQLVDLEWQKELARLRLSFQCLRRHVDGTEIDDPTVILCLSGVSGLAAYYSSAAVEGRSSDLVIEEPLSEAALSNWSLAPTEVRFHINSPHQALDMETACRIDWFVLSKSGYADGRSRRRIAGEVRGLRLRKLDIRPPGRLVVAGRSEGLRCRQGDSAFNAG